MKKTIYRTQRIFSIENTEVEHVVPYSFYLEDVFEWMAGQDDLFKTFKNTTSIYFAEGSAYIVMSYEVFDKVMTDFNEKQGNLININAN